MSNTHSLNLVDERWIPVVHRDGRFERLGLRAVLEQAAEIREIRGASPLDTVAIHRFLSAVLRWCRPDFGEGDRSAALVVGRFPADLLEKLGPRKQPCDGFDLLDGQHPFYQDAGLPEVVRRKAAEAVVSDVRKLKSPVTEHERERRIAAKIEEYFGPATYLIHELPTATNITHFRHLRDGRDGLCLACCASGLLRWSAYAASGTFGGGDQMPASINGPTPTYAVRLGHNLLETLLLNWCVGPRVDGDLPAWEGAVEGAQFGPLKALTWQPRSVLLAPPNAQGQRDLRPGVCCWCGTEVDRLVRTIIFRPGWRRPAGKRPWSEDPQLVRIKKSVTGKRRTKEVQALPSLPARDEPLQAQAATWREVVYGLIQRAASDGRSTRVQNTMMGANKALYQHATEDDRRIPHAVAKCASALLVELDWLEQISWKLADPRAAKASWSKPPKGHVIVATVRGPKAKGHAVRSGLSLWSPTTEREFEAAFQRLMDDLPSEDAAAQCEQRFRQWREEAVGIIERAVRQALSPTLTRAPLARAVMLRRVMGAVSNAARRDQPIVSPPQAVATAAVHERESPPKTTRDRRTRRAKS